MKMKYHTLTRIIPSTEKTSIPAVCTSFSDFLARSKTPWTVCVTAALVKPASAASHRPEAFIHRADSLSLWHSLCGSETSFTLIALHSYPLPNYHTPLGEASMGLSAQIWVNKSTKAKIWSSSVASSEVVRLYWTALGCKCVCIMFVSPHRRKISFSFLGK